jgi:predicted permease
LWSYPKYQTILEIQKVFDEAAAFASREISLTDVDAPERLDAETASERYFPVLGVSPILGRTFTREEATIAGANRVAVIGEGLWLRHFGGDRTIIGRTIHVNTDPYTVVGVLPGSFRGLSGRATIWLPIAAFEPRVLTNAYNHTYYIVGRRRPEVVEAQAIAAAENIGRQINTVYYDPKIEGQPGSALIVSLAGARTDADIRRATLVLLGAVGFVLLIACVNLTTLVSSKVIGRTREVAIRLALGASRLRVAQQLVVETAILATAGVAAGVLLAIGLLNAAETLLPDSQTFLRVRELQSTMRGATGLTQIGASMIGVDAMTLSFAAAAGLVCALLIACLPALQTSVLRPIAALKTTTSTISGSGAARFDLRAPLVVGQIAVALMLLSGAGLMLKSVWHLQATDSGIRAAGVLRARFSLPPTYPTEAKVPFYTRLMESVRAIPGVEAVAIGSCTPVAGGCNNTPISFDRPARFGPNMPIVGIYWATPDYFSTLGVRVLRGRIFTEHDRTGRPKVAVVNETAARQFWPSADPIGKIIAVGQGGFDDGAEVIGIVTNIRYEGMASAPVSDVYIPVLQSPGGGTLFVRSTLDTGVLTAALRRELRAIDPNLPLTDVRMMQDVLRDSMWQPRASAWLLSTFASLAVLLTAIGIFGVMAQTVSQRRAEFGIRLAIGAQARDVLTLVLGRAVLMTVIGLIAGLVGAFGLSTLMASLLYEVPARDASTFAATAVALGIVTLVAAYLPARRATRIDAIETLKAD